MESPQVSTLRPVPLSSEIRVWNNLLIIISTNQPATLKDLLHEQLRAGVNAEAQWFRVVGLNYGGLHNEKALLYCLKNVQGVH